MTLKHSPLTELMHAVLDGEASNAEARELETRLAADPAARAEFEDWKRLFEALDAVPKEHAPEGLVASIASAMPQAPGASGAASQPFPDPRVLGHTLFGISRRVPTRSVTMTEQSSRRIFAHRKAWLGGGIAAAAAVVVAQIAFDFPLPKDVVGTVIPAQRYRAAQNGSEQVQVVAPAGQATPTGTVPDASRALAEKSAAESAVKADKAQTELKADRMQSELKADKAQTELKVDRMQSEMKAEKVQADLKTDRMQSGLNADRSQSELKADRMQSDMKAEKAQADLKADRMQGGLKADRAQSELKADRMQSGIKAEKAQAELKADRMQSEMKADKAQTELKADRTPQQ
jgi:anti-sigma factor RsiW